MWSRHVGSRPKWHDIVGAQNGAMSPNVGPTFGNMSPTCRPTLYLGPKFTDSNIRHAQLCGGEFNHLSRRLGHALSQSPHSQTSFQQCQHQKLLSMHTNVLEWILQNKTRSLPRGHHWRIWVIQQSWIKKDVHCEIRYGLPQAVIIAQTLLLRALNALSYDHKDN